MDQESRGTNMESPLPTSDDDSNMGRRTNPSSEGDAETTEEEGQLSNERHSANPFVTERDDDRPLSPSILSESTKPDPPPSVQGEEDERMTDEEEMPRGGDANGLLEDTTQMKESNHLDYISVPALNDGRVLDDSEKAKETGLLPERSNTGMETEETEAVKQENLSNAAPVENEAEKAEATEAQAFINGDLSVMSEEKKAMEAEVEGRNGKKVYDAPPAQNISMPDSPSSLGRLEMNADNLAVMPRVDEHHPPVQAAAHTFLATNLQHQTAFGYPPVAAPMGAPMGAPMMMVGGRRKIHLRLQEEVTTQHKKRASLLGHIRQRSSRMMFGSGTLPSLDELESTLVDRGRISVSWFEGTSSLELQEHVRKSVVRKLALKKNVELEDVRVLDKSADPPEEIVLSPYIPDGSHFLLRFSTKDTANDGTTTPGSQYSSYSVQRPPPSPSAAPSPRPTRDLSGLNANQVALLRNQLNSLALPSAKTQGEESGEGGKKYRSERSSSEFHNGDKGGKPVENDSSDTNPASAPGKQELRPEQDDAEAGDLSDSDEDDMLLHSEDPIEARLRQITELLIEDRKGRSRSSSRRQEKRQVIFVLANYFVLFLSLIAISAEIQARAPEWAAWMEEQLQSVQSCSADQETLFKCVSNGDFAGLIASVVLWLSRSVATRRIFLFGFETPKKLWTVVYESLVTAFCWGISYIFIRRGMNPDTRSRFLQKYWKDAVYGSLAGFNAAFMKHILKNLIPQEAVEDALRERHLKILRWLPSWE